MKNVIRCLAASAIIASGFMLTARTPAAAAEAATHGCWYQPPNPPACDVCGWSCGSGQQCCNIQT